MGTVHEFDENEPRRGSQLPPVLGRDASHAEMVKAINGLAVELQLIREAMQEQGTRIGSFCERMEKAVEAMRATP